MTDAHRDGPDGTGIPVNPLAAPCEFGLRLLGWSTLGWVLHGLWVMLK